MNSSLPIITHLDHRIRVAKILLDIRQSTYGAMDPNLKQHLAELMNSRKACSSASGFAVSAREISSEKAPVIPLIKPDRHAAHADPQLIST